MAYVEGTINKLAKKHKIHMTAYGDENHKRLTGQHETQSFEIFSWGVGDRSASIRVPSQTFIDKGKGYIEDRRPASNIDPYLVGSLIADTTILEETKVESLYNHFILWTKSRPKANFDQTN